LLLRIKKGFDVAGDINDDTKGIWVWSQVLEYEHNGKPVKLLVMNTEEQLPGETWPKHDIKIFAMAALISSHFIYNSEEIGYYPFCSLAVGIRLVSQMTGNSGEPLPDE